ncbi:protein of unknown function [Hyphomicrobium sp. 1Nfss2.1]|uniref:hypothetical protein n=1 Tax=Hyphomicrobium sp. 1Nfss2.1 TaxID=3413936 RepID=UPI003C7CA2DF
MDTPPKVLGPSLRQLFASMIRRPMGWTMIDAFTRLEEREEAARDTEGDDSRGRSKGADHNKRS